MARLSREQIARIFGVTEEELADDHGYAEARTEANQQTEDFLAGLRIHLARIASRIVVDLDDKAGR